MLQKYVPVDDRPLSISEDDLQRHLSQSAAWGRDEPGDVPGASRKAVEPRKIKMGLVEEIENLHPELQIDPVAFFEDLVRRKIDIVKSGPREGVSSQVAIGPGRRPRKGTRIIVQLRSSQLLPRGYTRATCCHSRRGIAAEARVQVGTVRRPPVPVCGTVRSHAHGKGFPCAERANSIDRPAFQNHPYGFLLDAEWNGIGASEDEIVSPVEGGRPPVEARVQEIEHRVWFLACFAASDA